MSAEHKLKLCYERKEIIPREDGYYVYWPSPGCGYLTEFDLDIIADELKRVNAQQDEAVVEYFARQDPETTRPTIAPQVGKRYVLRNGALTGVIRERDDRFYPFTDGFGSWARTGEFWANGLTRHSDLIAEYVEPAATHVVTVTDACMAAEARTRK